MGYILVKTDMEPVGEDGFMLAGFGRTECFGRFPQGKAGAVYPVAPCLFREVNAGVDLVHLGRADFCGGQPSAAAEREKRAYSGKLAENDLLTVYADADGMKCIMEPDSGTLRGMLAEKRRAEMCFWLLLLLPAAAVMLLSAFVPYGIFFAAALSVLYAAVLLPFRRTFLRRRLDWIDGGEFGSHRKDR